MNLNTKNNLPLWAREKKLIWVEIKDKEDIEKIEYRPAIINSIDTQKQLAIIEY